MKINALLVQVLQQSRSRQPETCDAWEAIAKGFLVDDFPTAWFTTSMYREGTMDAVLRCLEDERVGQATDNQANPYSAYWLKTFSLYWIGGVYEILRRLREADVISPPDRFCQVLSDLELIRATEEWKIDRGLKKLKPPSVRMMEPIVSDRGSMLWMVMAFRARPSP